MAIEHVLAVVPVSDLERSQAWYAKLFGRAEDNNPMPTLVEWQVIAHAWVQVFVDSERAGSGLLNFAVDDLDDHLAEIAERGLEPTDVIDANKGVRIAQLHDPDGNTIGVIGGFRVQY